MNTFNEIDTSPEVNKGKIPPKILLLVNEAYKKTIKSLQGTDLVPFEKVRIVHEFMDYYNHLVHESDMCCGPGCCQCCYLTVELFLVEASYISSKTGIPMEEDVQKRSPELPAPCLFLDQKEKVCRVYAYRPIVCRNHLAFDNPKFCWPPYQKHIITTQDNGWGQPLIYQLAVDLWALSDPMLAFDIRAWFSKGIP